MPAALLVTTVVPGFFVMPFFAARVRVLDLFIVSAVRIILIAVYVLRPPVMLFILFIMLGFSTGLNIRYQRTEALNHGQNYQYAKSKIFLFHFLSPYG